MATTTTRNPHKRKANLKRIATALDVLAWEVENAAMPKADIVRHLRKSAAHLRAEAERVERVIA